MLWESEIPAMESSLLLWILASHCCRYEKRKTSPDRLSHVAKHKNPSKLEERAGTKLVLDQSMIIELDGQILLFIFHRQSSRSFSTAVSNPRQNSRELKKSSWSYDLVCPSWTWRRGDWALSRRKMAILFGNRSSRGKMKIVDERK